MLHNFHVCCSVPFVLLLLYNSSSMYTFVISKIWSIFCYQSYITLSVSHYNNTWPSWYFCYFGISEARSKPSEMQEINSFYMLNKIQQCDVWNETWKRRIPTISVASKRVATAISEQSKQINELAGTKCHLSLRRSLRISRWIYYFCRRRLLRSKVCHRLDNQHFYFCSLPSKEGADVLETVSDLLTGN